VPPDPQRPQKQRLFAALDLPDEIRAGLAAWGGRELSDPALRPVSAEALHITVCFLGWTPPERVDEAQAVIEAVDPRPVPVRLLLEPVAKPPRRPSLFAIEAEAPEAAILAGEVSARYRELGLAEEEKRPFWPHVTVARVRAEKAKGGSRRRRPQRVERPPAQLPDELGGEFGAVRLCLYRSMMRRDGSLYVPLCNLNLR
jgi:RNA 2',3'-cyclic 3'-phosphodiesterase